MNLVRRLLSSTFGFLLEVVGQLLKLLERIIPWHRMPIPLGLATLVAFRNDLRQHNLYDTSAIDRDPQQQENPPPKDLSFLYRRTPDGTYNDLTVPLMGSQGARFGRNFPLDRCWPEEPARLYAPSPREVANQVMDREAFKPATTLNVLAAAWIQFQNHEWFDHKRDPGQFHELPLKDNDNWHENPMRVERTATDTSRRSEPSNHPPTFCSEETHWWDGSQLYGSRQELEHRIRSGQDGKLKIDPDTDLLPLDPNQPGVELTGFSANYWVGLSLLHNLFVKEHNAICDRLKQDYPRWDDDRLFATARLVNSALMAKIHTVEWTPGILGHPTMQIAMHSNWWGLLGERITRALGRFGDSEIFSGIPGSPVDHHSAPYYLTEEFVSVYRLHPLIPDDYRFHALADDQLLEEADFAAIQGGNTRGVMERIPVADLFYSLGVANPGAVTLHNYPRALRNFQRPDGHRMDLASVDILRDRERGVPRYNDFREMLRKPRVKSFAKLTDNPQWARELERLYDGDIDRVDLMVGLYAEPLPAGFGFSDTAFRIFILMASRRLKSDRFFTDDYRPEVYTQTGMDWVNHNGFKSVLLRHYPMLEPAFHQVANPFAPWQRTTR